jgi:predicted nucleic acid-binding protein
LPTIRSVAADSNVLLSAIAGRAARAVLEAEPPIEIVTTEATLAEVKEYLPEFAERYSLDLDTLLAALAVLPAQCFSESDYVSHLGEARKYLDKRDPDDVHLAALAIKLGIPIWSNDRDFDELPNTDVYTTAELLKALGVSFRK